MCHVSFVAHETFVAFLTPVDSEKVHSKFLMTQFQEPTLPKWKISSMSPRVPHEFVSVPERLLAVLTRVSFVVAFVNTKMLCQMLAFGEGFGAHVTNVRPRHIVASCAGCFLHYNSLP
jgi:hypothetical protein